MLRVSYVHHLLPSLLRPRLFSRSLSTSLHTSEDNALFLSIGLDAKKASETATSPHLSKTLKVIATEAGVGSAGCVREVGVLLYTLATKLPPSIQPSIRALLAKWVADKKLKTVPQLSAALDYIRQSNAQAELDEKALEAHCGVGVVVSIDTIELVVKEVLHSSNTLSMMQQRRQQGLGPPLGFILEQVRTSPLLRWVDGATMRNLAEARLKEAYANITPLPAHLEVQQPNKDTEEGMAKAVPKHLMPPPSEHIAFPSPQENKQATAMLLDIHLKTTGGKVITRFPPEPNGYLHIGHAKAMHLDFGYATKSDGLCYLRFDDTNPETEKQEYIDSIIENIGWLGYQMPHPTYSSAYFDTLYNLATELIEREIAESRSKQPVQPSPYRDRPIGESLSIFREMKDGHSYSEDEDGLDQSQPLHVGSCCISYKKCTSPDDWQ